MTWLTPQACLLITFGGAAILGLSMIFLFFWETWLDMKTVVLEAKARSANERIEAAEDHARFVREREQEAKITSAQQVFSEGIEAWSDN